jgi:positive regulator of sigma E activity
MMPVVFLFLGAWVGDKLGPGLLPGKEPDFYHAIGGVLFLLLSVAGIRLYGKWVGRSNSVQPFVAHILN